MSRWVQDWQLPASYCAWIIERAILHVPVPRRDYYLAKDVLQSRVPLGILHLEGNSGNDPHKQYSRNVNEKSQDHPVTGSVAEAFQDTRASTVMTPRSGWLSQLGA